MSESKPATTANSPKGFLGTVERVGNALPDPAVLFIALLGIVWILSWLLSYVTFDVFHPATGERIVVVNQLAGENFVQFMATMVNRFMTFGPVGVVLVAMLGIGVAEHSGFISTAIRALLNITPKSLLTPMVILVGIISHSAVDAGYVLVIPIGGVIFYAAGRHPLAGIAAAFAGVSGGFSANFVPSSLDPLLQGLTLQGAQLLDPNIQVNVLNNYYFTTASSILITGLGWYLTDKVVEPRLAGVAIDGDAEDLPELHPIAPNERRGLRWALISMLIGLVLLAITLVPADSPWRDANGVLVSFGAPIMQSIVSLIFFLFMIPGIVYGRVSGSMTGMKGIIDGMTKSMNSMAYYLVIMFFIAQFVIAFGQSGLGTLLAISGANGLKALGLPEEQFGADDYRAGLFTVMFQFLGQQVPRRAGADIAIPEPGHPGAAMAPHEVADQWVMGIGMAATSGVQHAGLLQPGIVVRQYRLQTRGGRLRGADVKVYLRQAKQPPPIPGQQRWRYHRTV